MIAGVEYLKLLKKYNTLQVKYDSLKSEVEDKCFEKILETIGQPYEIRRLREENKKLRSINKELRKEKAKATSR